MIEFWLGVLVGIFATLITVVAYIVYKVVKITDDEDGRY